MNQQKLHCHELVYYLHQRIKNCFFTYSNIFSDNKHDDLFEIQYKMEREIFTWMIREILKSGEYTLDGIAYHTRIPLDILADSALGMQHDISITLWIKIADLFLLLNESKQIIKPNSIHY